LILTIGLAFIWGCGKSNPLAPQKFSGAGASAMTVPASALRAYYKLDGDFLDASGYGNHGKSYTELGYSPSIPLPGFGAGKSGQAAYFNSSNLSGPQFFIPNSSSITNMQAYTIAAWIYPTGYPSAAGYPAEMRNFAIMVHGQRDMNYDYMLQLNYQGRLWTQIMDSHQQAIAMSDQSIPLNQWTHVAVVFTGSKLQLYINGVMVKEANAQGAILQWLSHETTVGYWNIDCPSPFQGYIDEVRIYNAALSGSDLGTLCAVGNGSQVKAYWNMDGSSNGGTTNLLDSSGNGNNGTLVGNAWFMNGLTNDGRVLNLDGNNSYMLIPTYANFNNMQAFSLSAWIMPNSFNSVCNPIISKVDPNRDFVLQVDGSGRLSVQFAINGSEYHYVTSSQTVPIGQWTHVGAVWTGTQWQLFMNGALVGTVNAGGKVPAWTGTRMGIGTMDFVYSFSGLIDDVEVFSAALPVAQMYSIYQSGQRHTLGYY
jgi:MSHA biogenesis protein MshQ